MKLNLFKHKYGENEDVNVKELNTVAIKPEYMARIQEGIKAVLSYGTGVGYIDLGYKPAGKTGTSQSLVDTDNDGKVDTETISPILDLLRGSPELITKYLQGDNLEKEKHLEAFYTLLLYYMLYYEQDKINEILEDKNANHYYQKILFNSQIYFDRICLNISRLLCF